METKLKIQKRGNGLGINIPNVTANGLPLREGIYVNIQEKGHKIIIDPTKMNVSYNLTKMLSAITENNIHHCIETGTPTGNEIW